MGEAFNMSASGFRIEMYSPSAWMRHMAYIAKTEMRPFGVADATDDMRADVWRIKAWPSTPTKINNRVASSSVSHVVVRNKDKTIVVQPLTETPFPHAVQNAMGASLAFEGMELPFPGAGVRELWGAKSDQPFWISVIGPDWKYDFEVKPKHFEKLR